MLKHCIASPHPKSRTLSRLDKEDRFTSYRLYQQVDGFTKSLPPNEVLSIVIQQQLRSLIRRLLEFESNLREEQQKIIASIEEKDKVLEEQRKEIEDLKEKNKELVELLERKSPRESKRKRTQSVPNLACPDVSHVKKLIRKYESGELRSPSENTVVNKQKVLPSENLDVAKVESQSLMKDAHTENTQKLENAPIQKEKLPGIVERKLLRDITNLNISSKENIPTPKLQAQPPTGDQSQPRSPGFETPEKPKKKLNTNYDKFLEVTGLVQKSILTPSRIQKRKIKRNHVILRCNVNPALSRLVKEKLAWSSPNTQL